MLDIDSKNDKFAVSQKQAEQICPDQGQDDYVAVRQILSDLLPYIESHGGHVELESIVDGVVNIRFSGTCVQCPLSFYTVTYGIERHIKAKLPHLVRVEVVE